MKNVHLNQAFGPTPPCIRAAIERGFERGERRMRTRYRLRTACLAAAAMLIVCVLGFTAIHALHPTPDRVQYVQGTTQQPLTAVNFTSGEESVIETPFVSADDVATVHTLPSSSEEETQTIVLAQPEVAAAGASVTDEEFTETPETAAEVMPDTESADVAYTSKELAGGAEEVDISESNEQIVEVPYTPEPLPQPSEPTNEQISAALPTAEPLPADAPLAGTLQFSVEEAIFNDEFGFLLLRCSFDAGDWMQVTVELPADAAFVSSTGISIAEISPALDSMLAHSFGSNNGLRFAQTAVPEVLLPDGTRPLAMRIIEGENGAQEMMLAYSPDPKHNVPEYVNINLYLNGFLVNDAGECLAAYSEPIPLEATDSGAFSATGEAVTDKHGAYAQSIPVEIPVTRVRGGYAAKSGISHYWISGFGDWLLFHMQQDYDADNKEAQRALEGSFILTLADGTEMTLPITCMNIAREDNSEFWQVSALLSADECRTGDPAICRVTTMDGEFSLSEMLETEAPLSLALEMARLTEIGGESIPLPTPEPMPVSEQTETASDGPTAEFSTSAEADGPTAEFETGN